MFPLETPVSMCFSLWSFRFGIECHVLPCAVGHACAMSLKSIRVFMALLFVQVNMAVQKNKDDAFRMTEAL